MLAPIINTHVKDALSRLLQQYRGRPGIEGLYTALIEQVQILENTIYSLNEGRQLWDGTATPAIGAQLDGIGQIVGISRNGLSDAEYILFLFGKIAENFSDDTLTAIQTVLGYVFQAQVNLVFENFPASVIFEAIGSPIPQNLWPLAAGIVKKSVGGGIDVIFSAAYPTNDVFRFDGPGVSGPLNGFSDYYGDPQDGGKFIYLIE